MKLRRKVLAVTLALGAVTAPVLAAVTDLDVALADYIDEVESIIDEPTTPEVVALEQVTNPLSEVPIVVAQAVTETEPRWQLRDGTAEEQAVLHFFQEYGIKDRAALAVLLGNVKQESKFETNICEGGARGPYHTCRRGGFGLIQWTTTGRYSGLGRHAQSMGTSPDHLDTQLSYLVTEVEWKKVEHIFKDEGRSISSYMQAAYRWLGWGVKGNRGVYAQQYYNQLFLG